MNIIIDPQINGFYKVDTDEAVVTRVGFELRTGGINTCSVLIIENGRRQLMAHITALSDTYSLRMAIQDSFDTKDPSLRAHVIRGCDVTGTGTAYSQEKIKSLLEDLGISQNTIEYPTLYTSLFKDLVLKNKSIFEDHHKKPQEEILRRGDKLYEFITNAPKEAVRDLGNGRIEHTFNSAGGRKITRTYQDAIVGGPVPSSPENGNVGIYKEKLPFENWPSVI
jgi:hypothetical protein